MKILKQSLRVEKSLQLKQNVLFAAAQLFREKGFLNTTLSDVASQVGISKANIYNYFNNKTSLLYELLKESIEEAIKEARLIMTSSMPATDKFDALIKMHIRIQTGNCNVNYIGGIAVFERRNLPLRLRKKYDVLRNEYEHIFRNIFEEFVLLVQVPPCDTGLTVRLIIGMLNYIPHWFKNTGPLSGNEVANKIHRILTQGVFSMDNSP